MSEENPEAPVIENEAVIAEEGLGVATETLEEAVKEIVESPEEKIARLENEVKAERSKVEKAQKGIVKVKRKNQSKLERALQELNQTKAELNEYKGEQEQPKQQPISAQKHENIVEYRLKCKQLDKDQDFLTLFEGKRAEGLNPFTENSLINEVMARRGVDPSIVKYILTDEELSEELSDSEDVVEIVALLKVAKEREKYSANKPKEPIKKPVNTPKSIPSLKTNNTSSGTKVKQSTEDWYAEKYGRK